MKKMTCVVLGMAFLALGILGITGWVIMFRTDPIYVNIGEIILGALGFMVGVYAREGAGNNAQATVLSEQGKNIEQQKKDIEQQRKDIEQQRIDIEQQRIELARQKDQNNLFAKGI